MRIRQKDIVKMAIYQGNAKEVLRRLRTRDAGAEDDILHRVQEIVAGVRDGGDEALFDYSRRFDRANLDAASAQVSEEEFAQAETQLAPEWKAMAARSAERIRTYHQRQLRQSWFDVQDGTMLGQLIRPLARVGIYVPGGLANYPSTVLMNAIPAKVAGVGEIIMVSPARDGENIPAETLYAARLAGVDKVYKIGGAQAIAALAYGTQSIPRVDKITGPGSQYVALAKREVYGQVGIDMIAGPSEVLILADKTARPDFVAADLLAQAEHDPMAAAVLVTDDAKLAQTVAAELDRQLVQLPKRDIAGASIENYGAIVVVDDLATDGVALANEIAPEHLEIICADPHALLGRIQNAGAIFLGAYTPEALGDYMAGPNHTLPTNGTARFSSPLGVDDFIKKSSVLSFDREAMLALSADVQRFAESEGLDAHARSAAIRGENREERP